MTHTEICGICRKEVPTGEGCRNQQQARDCGALVGQQQDPADYQPEQYDDRDH